ncbi:hypothetical protein S7711_01226, partial [Stachybotrys chartarum IBT 7711]
MAKSILALAFWAGSALAAAGPMPIHLETRGDLTSHLANIHLTHREVVEGDIHFTYGSCQSTSEDDIDHTIAYFPVEGASRLVWIIPRGADNDGCISAWRNDGLLVGRSEPQKLHRVKRRAPQKRSSTCIPMTNETGIDTLGAWFDGVELLTNQQPGPVHVDAAKRRDIAIVGAGMSGLMTYLVLSQAGFTNLSLIEASERLGGRVRTVYLTGGPFDYSYQEMGPMRFPYTYNDPLTNRTFPVNDHRLVFDLADELNRINDNDANYSVDFINWVQRNPNGLYYFNEQRLSTGLPPTVGQVQANSSLANPNVLDPETLALNDELLANLPGPDFFVDMAQNMFRAHREFIDSGAGGLPGDQWSEFAFMVNYLQGSLNSTDMIGGASSSFWGRLYEGFFFSSATWRTIDGGLSRLPSAFYPFVEEDLTLGRKIERVRYADKRVTLQWREGDEYEGSTHDYAVIAVPFSILRQWRLPRLPATMANAIGRYRFEQACKVALEFSERFWEHYDNPIIGGCGTQTDIPGVGSVCYPSYNINGTGPATLLASYIFGDTAISFASLSEEDHVQLILDAMVDIHGEFTRALYTGKYSRVCWSEDPYAAMAFGGPSVGQHELYMPEYFKTHSNLIFVGEHTSVTQSWISSALDSGIRGAVQLMLELGLVDEAQEAVRKWMARWIDV